MPRASYTLTLPSLRAESVRGKNGRNLVNEKPQVITGFVILCYKLNEILRTV